MSRRLVGAAGRGVVKAILSPEKQALLEAGDIEGLIELNRAQFGSATMEDDGDEDDESDEDEDEDEDDDESDEDEDSDEEDDEDGDDDAPKGKRKKQDPKDVKIQELTAESKRHRLKAREHRTAREQAEAENAELKRKLARLTKGKKDDAEQDDEDEADTVPPARVQELERTNEDLLIRLEFMANQKHSWKNPKAALRLLDLSDVEIEDGEVVGLEEAIDQLAKDEPYLLKEKAKPEPKQRRRATGQPTGTKRKGNPNRDKLLSKYPALRR